MASFYTHLTGNYKYHLNYKIANIFRKESIPVRVTYKSYTLRRALSLNSTERTCTRANCPISNTNLCLLRNVVYQITCNNCNQHYIGSTTRFVHDRVREHLRNTFQSAKTKFTKASKSRPSRLKRTRQIYDYSKRFTFENTNLPSTPQKNAANSRTFYFNNYFNTSTVLSISTDGRRKVSATLLGEVGYFFL